MSTPSRDHPLDDTPRDAALARAYRDAVAATASNVEPPAALDDAVRAAARRAVQARPRDAAQVHGGGWFSRRWPTPLALAASMVLAVGVAIKVYDTGEADIRAARPVPVASESASHSAAKAEASGAGEARAENETVADANASALGQAGSSQASTDQAGVRPPASERRIVPAVPPASAPAATPPAVAAAPARPAPAAGTTAKSIPPPGTSSERADEKRREATEQRPGVARESDGARGSAGEAKPFPADRPEPTVRRDRADAVSPPRTGEDASPAAPVPPTASAPSPVTPPATAAGGAPAPSAASDSTARPPTPASPPVPPGPAPQRPVSTPERQTAPAESVASVERQDASPRAVRERAAMKVEPAQSPSGAATGPSLGAGAGLSGRMQSGAGPAAAPRPFLTTAKQLESRPAEDWIASIRELKRAGRAGEADELLAEFRKKFPDFALPDDLR